MKATAKDLRFHAKELLDAVERGETVTITRRGVPKAYLTPIKKIKKGSHSLFGIWSDRKEVKDVNRYMDSLRSPRHAD
ncbi:MAG: type II toxin-antitoxin system prevent-host-death family antitoxin [Balneolaceae bacterium]|jgi:prevent-host-death family protein|nr:MAG: type II toxin-antitoxin system prevent-host-death family antitoxin [Balneolaceae bacterium]